jgi:hypothetical protein
MAKSKKDWPEYSTGAPELLHALAVLLSNYNEFEDALFQLFAYHLERNDAPRLAAKNYYEMSERKRLDFIKIIFSAYEKEQSVKSTVAKLLKYFEWCMDARNRLAHARYSPPLFGAKNNRLYLVKRASRRGTTLQYMKPSLRELRTAADHVRVGLTCCVNLRFYLTLRDTPQNEWSLSQRLSALDSQSLPKIPPPPKKLRKSLWPHTPPMPSDLLRVRRWLKRS